MVAEHWAEGPISPLEAALRQTCLALVRMRAEASSNALAELVMRRYPQLDPPARHRFFRFLLDELGPDFAAVDRAISAFQAERAQARLVELAQALEGHRQQLVRAVCSIPDGARTVLAMRSDLLGLVAEDHALAPVEADLAHVLTSLFNRGFLELRRLDWNTPAHTLERLIEFEAVHAIRGWDDLRRRLTADRRCFGFFHPFLADEPVIFVEVALTTGIATSIQHIIDAPALAPGEAPTADTAVFYSISNCQDGLRGITFGSLLLKRVIASLQAELPELRTFVTLSPMPGFRRWLTKQPGGTALAREVDELPADGDRAAILALAARYLVEARSGTDPLDAVARFHLRNGARVEQVNWMGNTSAKGRRESCGVMVNYLYELDLLDENNERFVNEGRVARSARIDRLLAAPPYGKNVM